MFKKSIPAIVLLTLIFVGPRKVISEVSDVVHITWNKLTGAVGELEGSAEKTLRLARKRAENLSREQETVRGLAAMARVEAGQAREEWTKAKKEADANLTLARRILDGIKMQETRPNGSVEISMDESSTLAIMKTVSLTEARSLLEVARDRVEKGNKRVDILAKRLEWTESEASRWTGRSVEIEKEIDENRNSIEMARIYDGDEKAKARWSAQAGVMTVDGGADPLRDEIERALAVEASKRGLDASAKTTGTEFQYDQLFREQRQIQTQKTFESEMEARR